MKTYKVYTEFVQRGVYTVQAKDKNEAEEMFADNFSDYKDLTPLDDTPHAKQWDANEEILAVEEVKL